MTFTLNLKDHTWAIRVEWTPALGEDGWHVTERVEGESRHVRYGPMPAEAVTPLIAERRQYFTALRDSLCSANARVELPVFMPDAPWDGLVNGGRTQFTTGEPK